MTAAELLSLSERLDEVDVSEQGHRHVEVLPPHELLRQFEDINVCAPMVRYSKSAFRRTVSRYDTHICYTPMIVAREFTRSSVGRDSDFSVYSDERGTFELAEVSQGSSHLHERGHRAKRRKLVKGCLIAQFGVKEADDLAAAADLVAPYVDGIDINCGCPTKSATGDGIGAALLRRPELVADMVRSARARLGPDKSVSIKIRLDADPRHTDALIRGAAAAKADYVGIHGRTRYQASTHPVDEEGLAFAAQIAATCGLPTIANGDAWSLADAQRIRKRCKTQGVMSARGLLANPALFSGYESTPNEAVERFLGYAVHSGLAFSLAHYHISYMLESRFNKPERLRFNSLPSYGSMLDYLEETGIVAAM